MIRIRRAVAGGGSRRAGWCGFLGHGRSRRRGRGVDWLLRGRGRRWRMKTKMRIVESRVTTKTGMDGSRRLRRTHLIIIRSTCLDRSPPSQKRLMCYLGESDITIEFASIILTVHSYLQFFFNSSLVLLFLYLLVLFILTVQRDVQHRISEYSMGEFSLSFSFPFTPPCPTFSHAFPSLSKRQRPRNHPMRPPLQKQPLPQPHPSHGPPMRRLGDLHEPRSYQDWPYEGRRGSYCGGY